MAESILMPKVAMAMNEGTVVEWMKSEGEMVTKGEMLLSIETEKTAYEIEATGSGYLHILVDAGETVDVETAIAVLAIDENELDQIKEAPPAAPAKNGATNGTATPEISPAQESAAPSLAPSQATASGKRVKVSPLAKKLATDKGIDLKRVTGTGPNGRIKKRDILAFEASGAATSLAPSADRLLTERDRVPIDSMRRAIINNVMHANTHQCMSTGFVEVTADKLLAARQTFLVREDQLGVRVSLLAFFLKALAHAVQASPIINARLQDEEIVVYDNVNVSVAVAAPGANEYVSGLRMPVLKNVDAKGVVQIERDLRELISQAREGTLSPDQMSEGTVGLSSTAGLVPGSHIVSSPILNMGQSFMLQPGNIVERPIIVDGVVTVAQVMAMSYTFDHRVMDGVLAGQAVAAAKDAIENPELMLG